MPSTERSITPTPLDGVDVLLADLDGVVYRGDDAIPHAVESLNRAHASIRIGYLTNNAARTDAVVAAHLTKLGLTVAPEDVVTSPQAAVKLLADLVEPGSRILVVGGEGLVTEVERAGFVVVRSADDAPAAVIQGFAPHVAWTDLAEAAYALRAPEGTTGIPWVATNTDWTIPQARGTAPGNGTLVSAVHTAVGRLPVVAGKPERAIFDAAATRFSASAPLVVGDRLDTDIVGANRAGMSSALVLTGIDGPKQVLAADPDSRPSFLLGDLRDLFAPYPTTVVTEKRGAKLVTVGTAVVKLDGRAVSLARAGDAVDVLRAAAATIWGSGTPIYALDVAPELYASQLSWAS
ncbi:MAG TPA: HAD-IIA family hydrolase [Pseudolysinimonas sp.]|nr:HAD-IIA family hydrolase [Pseudolysinimonas sp.]